MAGAFLVLSTMRADYFAQRGLAVEAVVRDVHNLCSPNACPLCAAGQPLERVPDGG